LAAAEIPVAALGSRAEFEEWSRREVACDGQFVNMLGAKVRIAADEPIIGAHLARDGFWESWIALAIARRIEPGMRCLDVGANMGYYTALLRLQCGATGKVWAVEPSQRLCGMLRETVAANQWENVEIVSAALGDHNGPGTLWVSEDQRINGSLCHGWGGYTAGEPCQVRTLDALAAECGRIDFAKIDVDSSEEELWHFGRQALRQIPLVVLEVRADRYQRPAAFLANIRRIFPVLRTIDFDGVIMPISDEQICADPATDYLLWLER